MNATFRHRRSNRTTGLWCGLGSSAWAAFAAWVAATAPNVSNRLAAGAFLAGVPLAMTTLSLWVLAAYRHERLTIQGNQIAHKGVTRRKEIDLAQVIEARWRLPLPGSVVLRDASTRLAIPFSNYEDDDVERIVAHLRSALPPKIQTNWNLFAYKASARRERSNRTKPSPDEILVDRKRWDRFFTPVLVFYLLAVAVNTYIIKGDFRPLLVAPVPIVALWLLFRMTTPAKGTVTQKLSKSADPDLYHLLVVTAVTLPSALLGFVAVERLRPHLAHPDAIMIAWTFACLMIFLFEGHRLDRRKARRDREAADAAAKARGEAIDDAAWLNP
ncbi:MAG: hypothetical protein P4L85_25220 [Paludisphaera borealis]|uniref:hypothetical protein n=1 Tax=Paludisphaera borealis TaxID=1387353 RepID=UPI002848917D|nr:hypothetical protein [Paludisphaera borealis]MDR3622678.1 hypothetical protein [Paludisphaera borealis]